MGLKGLEGGKLDVRGRGGKYTGQQNRARDQESKNVECKNEEETVV